jgi:predicted TIM-barrel fold metal-dependent hydrolase
MRDASSPPPLEQRRAVVARIEASAARLGRTLGMDRRAFLRSSGGMAATFLALNEVYGRFFRVDPAEAAAPRGEKPPRPDTRADPDAARPDKHRDPEPPHKFIFDVHTHHVRAGYAMDPVLGWRRFAAGDNPQRRAWSPSLGERPVTWDVLGFESWVREVFIESETDMAVLGAVASDDPARQSLSSEDAVRSRDLVNRLAGSRRALAHGLIRPGRAGVLEEMDRMAYLLRVDGWVGDTIGDDLADSPHAWRMDDEKVAYPVWTRALKLGITNVCIRKGLVRGDEQSVRNWRFATVDDVGRAAKDWPQLHFVIAHAACRSWLDATTALQEFRTSGRIPWVTDLAAIPSKYGVRNVFADVSGVFASTVTTVPELTAAILGQLVKGMGPDHVLWGTDAVWSGSPQWQIEAFRRFEIPDEMQHAHGFVPLAAGNGRVKRQIFGQNAAWLYHIRARQPLGPVPLNFKEKLRSWPGATAPGPT